VGEQQHPRHRLHLRRNPTWPRTATRSEDLHLEGTCWHHAWAIAARVSSGNPARADGSTGRSVASASCPPRTSARLMASATRLRRWSCQWTARPGSGRRSLFSSQLCLCPCWHRCLRLRLIAERPRVSLTKQGKPRAARPTEPRDSYASGIRIPHSSPSHEATHTWLSGSASRQASPSARNEEETRLHAKIHTCSGPDSRNEQTSALKVPLQTELWFRPRRYEQPPTLEGLRGDKTPTGGSPPPALATATTTSAPGSQTAAAMTSGQTLLRQGPRPRPHSRDKDKLPRPWSQGSVHGRHRLSRRRRNLFQLPRWEVAPEAAPKPLRPESQTRGSCQHHERRTPFPPITEGRSGPLPARRQAPTRRTPLPSTDDEHP
jgi:hypothetical protein